MAVGARKGDGFSDASSDSGEVYLYKFDDGDFTNATLIGRIGKGYTGNNDLDISSIGKADKFGRSVSFNSTGSRLVVGATGDDGNNNNSVANAGAVYLITFTDNNGNASTNFENPEHVGTIGYGYTNNKDVDLSKQGENNAPVIEASDLFGVSVALDGDADVLAVGSYGDHGYSEAGSEKADSGSVFMISLNSDFKGGEVKSRIGHGYTYNTG